VQRLVTSGVKTVIVETASHFARDRIIQETGYAMMKTAGLELIAADKPDAFLDDTSTAVLIRLVLGAVSEFEKAMVVSKLKGARDPESKAAGGRVEGRKGVAEKYPAATKRAKELRRIYVTMSLRDIAVKLASEGFMAAAVEAVEGVREGRPERPFSHEVVKAMLDA
jgi:hypothetical protein